MKRCYQHIINNIIIYMIINNIYVDIMLINRAVKQKSPKSLCQPLLIH